MTTLADVKRALHVGARLTCTFHTNPGRIGWKRQVVKVNTVGVCLIDPTEKEPIPSYLNFPKASLMEIEGNKFRIYDPGYRELTPEEKAVVAGEPRDPVQQERDCLGDGNVMFYRRKAYYASSRFPYLHAGMGAVNGVSFDGDRIRDPKIKGKLMLEYALEGN
jgi:hypothetical protein